MTIQDVIDSARIYGSTAIIGNYLITLYTPGREVQKIFKYPNAMQDLRSDGWRVFRTDPVHRFMEPVQYYYVGGGDN